MGILSRILGRTPVERRWGGGDGWGAVGLGLAGGGYGHHGAAGTLAQTLAVTTGCIEMLAGAVSILPRTLVIDTPDGRQPAPRSCPEWDLLERPNPRTGWPSFAGFSVAQQLIHGNSLTYIQADQHGTVRSLVSVPWTWVSPAVIDGGGGVSLIFDLTQAGAESQLLRLPGRLLSSDAMHMKSRGDTGIIGRSVLSRASGVVQEAAEIQTAARANWNNGLRPSSILTSPAYLNDAQRKRKGEWLDEFSGAINAGKTPLLEGGWELKTIAMSSVDAEFLGQRQFSVDEICRLFGIPSVLMQLGQRVPADLAPFTAAFASQALAPIVANFEAEFDYSVLPAGMHLQLDMSGLLRGSYSAAVGALCAAVQSGIATPNDARRSLGLAPLPSGDELRPGSAPSWPATFKGGDHLGPSPGPTGGGLAQPGTNSNEGSAGE